VATIVRLGVGDPGKKKSKFGILVLDILPREVRVMGAKQLQMDYTVVEAEIEGMHKRFGFQRFVVEWNNVGQHVVDSFRRYHPTVPLWPVTTIGRVVTDQEKIQSKQTMHKQGAAEYVKRLKDAGILKFPEQSTPDLEELKRQMEGFLPHGTDAGHISYYTEGEQPDDLVMCLIMGCFVGQAFMEQDVLPTVMSMSNDSDYWAGLKTRAQEAFDKTARKKIDTLLQPGIEISNITTDGEAVEYGSQL
jgi:hypothetical protein